jgi:hypothetical protein
MAYSLNVYCDFIDATLDTGIKLINSVIHQFKSPLIGTIQLSSSDALKFTKAISNLANQYGSDFLLPNTLTTNTVVPGVNPGDAATITNGDCINLLETFSDTNIDAARKHATVIWGDGSFTTTGPMTIRQLELAKGEVSNHSPPRLTPAGKVVLRDRLHSKILAYQVMAILDDDGQRTLDLEKDLYTWKSADGRDTKYDGFLMVAIAMSRVKPHYHVDMWIEMKKIKELTLKQFENDVVKYLDEMKSMKLLIDEKDRMAYTDKAYVKDLLSQLKIAPVSIFASEYEQMETRWLRGKEIITSTSLWRDATAHFIQLSSESKWVDERSAKD